MTGKNTDVLLISMPFGPLLSPSIALGLLKSGLQREGHSVRVHYFTIAFAERIGVLDYERISNGTPDVHDLLGEWMFSRALYGFDIKPARDYIDNILLGGHPAHWKEGRREDDTLQHAQRIAVEVRPHVEPFLCECLDYVLKMRPTIVGFTSTYEQHVASLALAKRIKEALPGTAIIIGGANCEGPMGGELMRQFRFLDAVVTGEGDDAAPELVRRILADRSLEGIPAVITRANADKAIQSLVPAGFISDMDGLPIPEYSDYVEQWKAAGLETGKDRQKLLMETGRGCWWGARHHCTFCGLNGETMAFRSKSADRALVELDQLVATHPGWPIVMTDNIMNIRYFRDFIPELGRRDYDTNIFYEMKANITKDQVRALRAANVTHIQPGIESLSTEVLRIMKKGVRAIQNVQLLKWCKEVGVHVAWNFIWGFPGESPAEYETMARYVPYLTHLRPPSGGSHIRMDRFSPNFHSSRELGFTNVAPYASYGYVHPFPPEVLFNLAYYFSYGYAHPQAVREYTANLGLAIRDWIACHKESDLFHIERGNVLIVCDLRPIARTLFTVLQGRDRWIYLECDAATKPKTLLKRWNKQNGNGMGANELSKRLGRLVELGIVMREQDEHVALSVALGDYQPSTPTLERLLAEAEKQGLQAEPAYASRN